MSSLEKSVIQQIRLNEESQKTKTFRDKTKTYRGVSTVDLTRKSIVLFDIELIKQDIINHFHIRQGEKLSDPSFGTILWDVLFEPLTTTLKDKIINNVTQIINYDPRVNVDRIVLDEYESGISIECTLTYLPYNFSETMKLKFDEKNGLLTG